MTELFKHKYFSFLLVGRSTLEKTPSGGPEIIIGVENESGEPTPVDIDDTDDQLEDEGKPKAHFRLK